MVLVVVVAAATVGRGQSYQDREADHEDIVANYFSDDPIYTDRQFRQRFRMTKSLFLQIVSALGDWSPYFKQRVDAQRP